MGIALVSVPAPHQSLLSQRPNISSNTWLHGSATTSIRYPSKLTILHCSSSTSVVEEGLPPPPPPDSIPVQSESATNDTDKLPLRYYNFLILNSCQPSLDIDKFFNLENHYQLSSKSLFLWVSKKTIGKWKKKERKPKFWVFMQCYGFVLRNILISSKLSCCKRFILVIFGSFLGCVGLRTILCIH